MTEHPPLDVLAASALNALEGEAKSDWASHLSSCEICRREIERLERLARLAATAMEADPPERVYQRALSIRSTRNLPVVEAELIEDTALLVGVRGDALDGRVFLYRADEIDIHLQIVKRDGGIANCLGQLHSSEGDGLSGAVVTVSSSGQELGRAITDELGEFHLSVHAAFPVHVDIEDSNRTIRTPPIPGWRPI